jgi:4-hydroxybenzoate decarboxylase
MALSDFREFVSKLEREGQLIRFHDEILPEPGVRSLARAAADMIDDGPAILLDNVKGYRGKKLAINVLGSWANYALMMGMEKTSSLKEMFHELNRRWLSYPGEVKYVSNPACQENIVTKNINLYEMLPLFKVNPYDGGCYLSKAAVVSKDPDDPGSFDKANLGVYRLQVHGPDTIGLNVVPSHDMAIHLRNAEAANRPLPVAICIGVHPLLMVMACTPIAYDKSEYRYAAALDQAPQEIAKAVTCDLDVPAGAEWVLEGEVIPRTRTLEGPFADMTGSYSSLRGQFRIQVKAVTHRHEPIFENLYCGKPWTEHDTLIGLSTSVPIFQQLRETMPEVTAVNALYQHGLTVIVAAHNRFGGYAKTIGMRVATTPHGVAYAKNIVIVDGDVDPFNPIEVRWALSTRVRPDKDVVVIPNTPGHPSDPSSDPPGMGAKLIIDATTPAYPDKVSPKYRVVEKVPNTEIYRQRIRELQAGLTQTATPSR